MKTRQQIESIARGKKKLRMTVLVLAIFILLLAATITVWVIASNEEVDTGSNSTKPPEIIEGEAIYRNQALAYPLVDDSKITRITVNNTTRADGAFTFVRTESAGNDFLFTYMEDGEVLIYYPSICTEDSSFEYSDLYAYETNDGYGTIHRLTYLTSALETAYFGERIPLSADETERAAQYKEFGLDADTTTVVFDYTDDDGETQTHRIVIGDRTVNGAGYYFMVDGRDYVYNSISSYYDYALLGFYSFVKTSIVAAGLEDDSTLEPIYTSDFTHWKTEVTDTVGATVPSRSEIVISANMLVPIAPSEFVSDPSLINSYKDAYDRTGYEEMTVDLYSSTAQEALKNTLVGRELGKYYDPTDPSADKDDAIILTLTSDFNSSKLISFGNRSSVKYGYTIVEIESIINEGDDITETGTAVGEHDLIKVAYYYTVDGRSVSNAISHAVIDLSSELIPSEATSELRSLAVGKLTEDDYVRFDINYTKENAVKTVYQAKITEIIEIYDAKGNAITTIAEDSQVSYRYQIIVNGVVGEEEYVASINLAEPQDDMELALKEQLIGRKAARYLSIVVDSGTEYCEIFKYFRTYEISEIKYYVTKTEVISLSFLSNSERDPFYGDSIYENNTDGYSLYGLNYTVCDHVLKLLGGVGDNTSQSAGLKGTEMVSVGITSEKLLKYGLYAHRVYFELPRGLVAIDSGDEDVIDDYTAYEKLCFTLYISEIQDDGTRYVASDLYDTITKIGNDEFFFLDKTFVDFWARRNLIMTDVTYMQNIKVDFYLEDLKGSYDLDIVHKDAYLTSTGLQIGGTPPTDYYDTYDRITVNVTPSGECTPSLLTEYIEANGRNYMSLDEVYQQVISDESVLNTYFPDSYGTTYFKEFIRSMFYVDFEGAMSEQEQKEALENFEMIMKFSIKIDTDRDGEDDDESYYSYEFYRCSDRRVLVRLYREDGEGNKFFDSDVSDFYISTHGFKKIVNNFTALLNGVSFDQDTGYDY